MRAYDYDSLITDICETGREIADTKTLYNVCYRIDLRRFSDLNLMVMPMFRGSGDRKTSIKYALAEACWYMNRTRNPELIENYGSIWSQMKDENGYVNSNYGFQIAENGFSREDCIQKLSKNKVVTYDILSKENMNSTNDLACNQRIRFSIRRGTLNSIILDAQVFTRSLDMIFGLPYDMFAAQGIMYIVRDALSEKMKKRVVLGELTFRVSNCHVYNKNKIDPNRSEGVRHSLMTIDFYKTPYSMIQKNDWTQPEVEALVEISKSGEDVLIFHDEYIKKDDDISINYFFFEKDALDHLKSVLGSDSATYKKFLSMYEENAPMGDRKRAGIENDGLIINLMNLREDKWALTKCISHE